MVFNHLQECDTNMVKDLMPERLELEQILPKIHQKRVVQKTAESSGDLNNNKIANKITSKYNELENFDALSQFDLSKFKTTTPTVTLNSILFI